MRVAMIGAGYVGLVSGACFADFGHQVTCIDKDAARIAALKRGEIPIFEPGLAELVESNVRQGRLEFAAETSRIGEAEAIFIAVGTPSRRGDGHADLSFVYQAVREVAPLLDSAAVVITKSTVPVGTGDEIENILREKRPDADIQVASNPEFLREGAAIQDFKHPDRIVVGSDDDRTRKVLAEIYRPLYLNTPPIIFVSRRTAELIKYASNAFLATKITFINEMADLCEQVGADVHRRKISSRRSWFWRLVLPQRHQRIDQDCPRPWRTVALGRDGFLRQRAAQTRHGAQSCSGARRLGARQDHCGAWADLQAEHRRYP